MKGSVRDNLLLFICCFSVLVIFTLITLDSKTYISKETLVSSFKNI